MHGIHSPRRSAGALAAVRAALLALVTPLLEKNPVKALAADTAFVFSITRLIWLAFAIVYGSGARTEAMAIDSSTYGMAPSSACR